MTVPLQVLNFGVLSLEYDTNWICVVLLCIGNTVVVVATLSFVNDNLFRRRERSM